MFSKTSVKLSRPLVERATLAAQRGGYSSLEEFVEHAIEKELARGGSAADESTDAEEAAKQLRGLGYLE
jgi:Arc/MetJ-type ribon-helix-helix transcriptional regulator